jgi:hypothetical protein
MNASSHLKVIREGLPLTVRPWSAEFNLMT